MTNPLESERPVEAVVVVTRADNTSATIDKTNAVMTANATSTFAAAALGLWIRLARVPTKRGSFFMF
jgi:hypothetical protein